MKASNIRRVPALLFSWVFVFSLPLSFSKDSQADKAAGQPGHSLPEQLAAALQEEWDVLSVSFVHRCPCTGGSIRKVMLKRGADGILTLQADVQYRALHQKGDPVVFRGGVEGLKLGDLPNLLRLAVRELSENEVISHFAKDKMLTNEEAVIRIFKETGNRDFLEGDDTLSMEVLIHRGDKELFKAASDFARDGKAKEFVEWFQVWAEAAGVPQILSKLEEAR
jgi:hypothetical protein